MNDISPIKSINAIADPADQVETQEFPRAIWFEDLIKLNPWAEPFLKDGLRIATEEFSQVSRQSCHARWLAGRVFWNGWAVRMLKLREMLETAQLWYVDQSGEGTNEETKSWLALADAVFSSLTLARGQDGYIDFEEFIFPATAWFVDARFTGETRLAGARFYSDAHFSRAVFVGRLDFQKTRFNGDVRFREASFTGNAGFEECVFYGNAIFDKARFTGSTNFNDAKFNGISDFSQTRFIGDATYEETRFTGDASFNEAHFAGTAWFPRSTFIGNTSFSGAVMTGDAWFSEAKFIGNVLFDRTKFPCNSRFENTRFCGLTSFKDAEFSDSARFTTAHFTGDTELATDDMSEAAEINTISITGPMREEREKRELDDMFPSLAKPANPSLEGAEFTSVPDFQGVKADVPPNVTNMTVTDPIKTRHDWDGSKKKNQDLLD